MVRLKENFNEGIQCASFPMNGQTVLFQFPRVMTAQQFNLLKKWIALNLENIIIDNGLPDVNPDVPKPGESTSA